MTLTAVRGELFALLLPAGFALLGSEFDGVGWSSASKLALLGNAAGPTLLASECELRGGETDTPLFGGTLLYPGSRPPGPAN